MKKLLRNLITHGAALAIGFGLGIYLLPILTAPPSPDAATLEQAAASASFKGEFTRDLKGSDFVHWGEGSISLSGDKIVHMGTSMNSHIGQDVSFAGWAGALSGAMVTAQLLLGYTLWDFMNKRTLLRDLGYGDLEDEIQRRVTEGTAQSPIDVLGEVLENAVRHIRNKLGILF